MRVDVLVELEECSREAIEEARRRVADEVRRGVRRIAVVLQGPSFTECLDELRGLLHAFIQAGITVYESEPPGIDDSIPRIRIPVATRRTL